MTDTPQLDDDLLPGERPTLKTISRITGLAVATVSRALNDAPDISADTKKRVRECADRIDYLPNRAGVRLRTGKTNVISLIVSTEHDIMNHTARLLSSIAGGLRNTPYHLVVTPFFPDEDPMRPVRYVVETGSADAIILNQTEPDDPRVAYLMKKGFPFVTHGQTNWSASHPYCDFDNRTFAELGIEALARRGRKCVLVVAPPPYHFYGKEILDGTKTASERLGLTRLVLQDVTTDSSIKDVGTSVRAALNAHPEIDAILCGSTNATVAAIGGAEAVGRVLGVDFDVFSKEATTFLNIFRSQVLVVSEDVGATGASLARAALQAIDHPSRAPIQELAVPTFNDPLFAAKPA
ncbi:LacI family transcriptional regulator [Celeribacter marinus]|uniref:Putative LacI family transcriptional regulator n=1 Tax=Celeribacter marinus TaxID=1397108 RepID=A0A0N9ZF28_9RHOB|nr:LacI family transcriptional regulator [Celeribacter marinus]ALI54184.1 putative LacI family transcriptional regulator [Celeribacter marinus]SFK31090.1 transcriptional regulator, LacI family [Celeribacter marinus]